MPTDKFIITKKGYYLVDNENKPILDAAGEPLTFATEEAASKYLKNNKISGKVK